ncbi:SusD/RagB family nutrient-binding outer membrane lipoprotein [Acetobacteroides hydrogenigenes]|uniref:SusD-like starch-binding protein associating with outer membrane n=1 Tax=Acetobacteroides hydrogenigenes TaxID=979970 RepID=A0A4R2E9B8_9BACT|nr:SusD/RagB family nutrient-binding outer membrane lipoprotein [Acetobacteroides hydrogenigenes]TCN64691.1 SusD-like starch-binding protein associating with outer membrane [Acetobacteroides hydrogenigenes]
MKTIKLYSLIMLLSILFGCSEDAMDTINNNPNNPKKVESRFILTDVMTSTAFSITGSDYAFYSSVYMELNVGIWGQMYNAEKRLVDPASATTYNNSWNAQYRNLYELKTSIEQCSENGPEKGNFVNLGISQILFAYNLAMLTDLMGDIPVTEALQPGKVYQPRIDKQEAVYTEVFRLLDEAILNLGKATTYPSIGNQDLIYKGDKAKWIKAANALKARFTMRLSFRSAKYDKVIEYANASFTGAAEELKYTYTGSASVNPFSRFFQDRNYFGASKSLSDKLTERNDPRSAKFFKPATGQSSVIFAPNGNPEQRQAYYGYSGLTSVTAPTYLMSYHELQFLKAEALVRSTPSQVAAAETELVKGIQAAFVKVGLTATDATTYYNNNVKARFDANPLKEIMIQKYLASYEDEGIEAYNDYRRLKAMGDDLITLASTLQFPQRFTYGSSDVTTNPNVRNAYGDGSYVYTEKVWWAGGTR